VSIAELQLSPKEARLLETLAKQLSMFDPKTQPDRFVLEAQILSAQLPEWLRRGAQHFRRFGSPCGALLIRNLPTGHVPETPSHADAAVGMHLQAACVMAIVAALIGEQFGFKPELAGNIFQDILPVLGYENTQQSISSVVPLTLHFETVFSEDRADFVALFCVRSDRKGNAGTYLAPLREVLSLLDRATIAILRQARFTTTVDASFLRGSQSDIPVLIGPIAALYGSEDRFRGRVDFEEAKGLDADAEDALLALREAAERVKVEVQLTPGDLIIIDNHGAFHGRASFQPQYDGSDRWLIRTFLALDLGRSIAARPGDGRILDADFRNDPMMMKAPRTTGSAELQSLSA